jgi:hypothetical protein
MKDQQHPVVRRELVPMAGGATSSSATKPPHRTAVGRSKSTDGVRRLLGVQWSQRLQSHLKHKMEKGPSTHEPRFDGESSNSNFLAQMAAEREPSKDRHNLSASRLDQSITGEIIAAGWLLSPKRSSKNNSATSVSNNNNQNSKNNSYNTLDRDHEFVGDKDKVTGRKNRSYSESRSRIFPPGSNGVEGSGSTLFDGINDFLNMSSGPVANMNFEQSVGDEFDVVRQPAQQQSSNKSPSRLSIFGSNKSRPVSAPQIGKQLNDFRLRRQGKTPKEKEDTDGTGHFSVTTEKLSAHTARDEGDEEDFTLASSEGEDEDLDPARSPMNPHNYSAVRQLNASGGFHLVEDVLSARLQRYELKNEIELRREKFKNKLSLTTAAAAVATKERGIGQSGHDNDNNESMDLSGDMQAILLSGENIAQMAADTKEVDLRLTTLTQEVEATRRKPRRTQSSSTPCASSRSSSAPDHLDNLSQLQKSTIQGLADGESNTSAMEDLFFDDDDNVFFGNKAGGKKRISAKERKTSGSSVFNERSSTAEAGSERIEAQPFEFLPGRLMPAKLTRARTTSFAESHKRMAAPMTTSAVVPPLVTEYSIRSNRTMSVRSERSGGSIRSERTSRSASAAAEAASDNASHAFRGSVRSHRTMASAEESLAIEDLATTKLLGMRRRATVGGLNFDETFQIVSAALSVAEDDNSRGKHDENSSKNSSKASSKKKAKKRKEFEETFTSEADKSTTELFHQSFAIEYLATPLGKKRTSGSSLPNMMNMVDQLPNLLENSLSLLSTVDEISLFSRHETEDKKPRRRKSLPTGSSHGPAVNVLMSPKRNAGKPKTAKHEETTPRRRRRRHSLSSAMGASMAALQLDQDEDSDIVSIPNSRSAAVSVTPDSKQLICNDEAQLLNAATKMPGIAPSKADAQTARRRTSVKVEPVVTPELKETQVDRIRMRRRTGSRVQSTTEKAMLQQRPELAVSGSQSIPVETSTSTNENAASSVSQRRRDRQSKRHSVQGKKDMPSEPLKMSSADGAPVKRSTIRDATSNAGTGHRGETSRKKSTRSLTPNGARRARRRTQSELTPSNPKTPIARKERVRRVSVSDVGSMVSPRIPVFNDATIARVRGAREVDVSRTSHTGRSTPSSLRRIARPRCESSMDESATRSEKSSDRSDIDKSEMDVSDDGSLEPTPKPKAPQSLPMLATRGTTPSLKPAPKTSRPRRQKSDTSATHKLRERHARRKNSADASPITESPSTRSKARNRSCLLNGEASKEGKVVAILSPRSSGKPHSIEASAFAMTVTNLLSDTETKARPAVDKRLLAELCRSPGKPSRIRRRKSQDESDSPAMKESPKPPRRSRRNTIDAGADMTDGNDPAAKSPHRRRRTDIGDSSASTRSRLLRRVKTIDNPLIDVDADTKNSSPLKVSKSVALRQRPNETVVDGRKTKADTSQTDAAAAITNKKKLLDEINF